MNKPRLVLAFSAVLLTGPMSPAIKPSAATAPTTRLLETGPAGTPFAHTRFCLRYPDDCKVKNYADSNKPVLLSFTRLLELVEVNTHVNTSIAEQRQDEGPAFEKWLIYPIAGDCNDFAVTKRHLLIKKGWPDHALLLTEVKLPSGEHHLVLVVHTSDGDLILDNRTPALRSVGEADKEYRWVRMESKDNPQFWSTVVQTSS